MKIVFFGNDSDFSKEIFLTLLKLQNRKKVDIVFAVNTEIIRNKFIKRLISCFIKKVFNPFDECTTSLVYKYFTDYVDNEKLLQTNKLNDKDFIAKIKNYDADYAIVAGCGIIFKKELLSSFRIGVVNYHNSLLPKYKGLGGESLPFYFNEPNFGYTFHFMTENIDDGNIIHQKEIKIDTTKSLKHHHKILLKTLSTEVIIVVDKLLNKEIGFQQKKIDSYFGKKEIKKLQEVISLDNHSYDELKNVIKCFGSFLYKGKKNH